MWKSPYKLAANGSQIDQELFEVFYRAACQYVHVDVLSARAYFYDADPFNEVDPALVAGLISIVLIGNVVRELSRCPGVDQGFEQDINHFLTLLAETITLPLQLVRADEEHANAVVEVVLAAVKSWLE